MARYEALLAAVLLYTVGDLLAERGSSKEKMALHRVGCLMVAAAFAILITLWVVELCGI